MLAAVLLLSLGQVSYADAYQAAADGSQPLVVVVSAKWCPHCPAMVRNARASGVRHAVVDYDQQRPIASKLLSRVVLPALVVLRRGRNGWLKREYFGVQSIDQIKTAAGLPFEFR